MSKEKINGCTCGNKAPKISFGSNIFMENPVFVRAFHDGSVRDKNKNRKGIVGSFDKQPIERIYTLPEIEPLNGE